MIVKDTFSVLSALTVEPPTATQHDSEGVENRYIVEGRSLLVYPAVGDYQPGTIWR